MAPIETKQRAAALIAEADKKSASGDYDGAIAVLDKALVLDPKNDDAWNNRGHAKNALRRYADAIQDLDEAIRLNPNNKLAVYNKEIAKYNKIKKDRVVEGLLFTVFLLVVIALINAAG